MRIVDQALLRDIAKTSMESKIVSVDSDILADLAAKAILAVAQNGGDKWRQALHVGGLDNVKIQKKPGGAMSESTLIQGIIVDKEIVYSDMPKRIKDARILLLNSSLEIEKTEP